VSRHFGDVYFSLDGGLAQARHVFIDGNDLRPRFAAVSGGTFQVAELGFGTGLNFIATWAAWESAQHLRRATARLVYTGFELYPLAPADMARALSGFPSLASYARGLVAALAHEPTGAMFESVCLRVIVGDARGCLPAQPWQADAWFLDGFAPAKNPQLWEPALLRQVFAHTKAGGTAATYTAAGGVRRALAGAGFRVMRIKGCGRKRHMTCAYREGSP